MKFKDFLNDCTRWEDADKIITKNIPFKVKDFRTGKKWNMVRTSGKFHADVEYASKEDKKIMDDIWGINSLYYRKVKVFIGDRILTGALMNVPHAGKENVEFKNKIEYDEDNPADFLMSTPNGANWDKIKNNGASGHVCLHFIGSLRHKDKLIDDEAQKCI